MFMVLGLYIMIHTFKTQENVSTQEYHLIVPVHFDVIKWKQFHVTGPLWGESTSYQWIPLTKGQ